MRRCDQRIYCDQAKRRGRVDDDYLVLFLERLNSILQTERSVEVTHQLRFEFCQADARGNYIQVFVVRLVDRKFASSLPVHHQLVRRSIDRHWIEKRNRAVGLGIEIEEKRFRSAFGKRGSQVDGGGGLSDATFLISNRDYQV